SFFFVFFFLIGKLLTVLLLNASQCSWTGHMMHFGVLGVQIVAPSSIRAWLKSPASSGMIFSISSFTDFWTFAFVISRLSSFKRDITRRTLPSTAASR